MHFLLYQNHLDKVAKEHEAQGKDASRLRDHLRKELGFTPAQFAVVRASARQLELDLRATRAQAIPLIEADRAARLNDPFKSTQPRQPSAEIKQLSKQREDLIQQREADLDRQLGPQLSAKLQDFLEHKFIRNVTSPDSSLGVHPLIHLPPQSHHRTVQP
jgi:hypothetical protein